MISRSILAALAILASASAAVAQQYRWVDEKGRVRYSDSPPPATAKNVQKKAASTAPAATEQLPFELQRVQKEFPVTLYTAPVCKQPCELARGALNKRGIPFNEVQVWNVETLEQLKALAGSDNVPALAVGRSALSGFDPARFDAMLDSAGYPKAGALPARSQPAPPPPEGYEPPPVAEPLKPAAETAGKPGPYDASGLKSSEKPKPRLYDTSGLKGETPKPGPYGVPGGGK